MKLSWHGLSCFELTTKSLDHGEVKVVIDPYQNTTGLRFPRTLEAAMVLQTHDEEDANNRASVSGEPFIIDMPGEFEVKGVFVFGIPAPDDAKEGGGGNIIYRLELERMRIAHLGAMKRALTDEELQKLGNIDILMIPVGGNRVMTPKVASEVISQIEPRVVIPMTHLIDNVKEPLGTVDDFCKELGACRRETASTYKVKRKDLPEEDMLIMTLTR